MNQAKQITLVKINELRPNPKNNNKHDQSQIDRLAKIIKYSGFRNPVIVSNQSGLVVAGHARLKAAELAGFEEVPVIYQDFETPEMEYAHLTADNAISEWAFIDRSMINDELPELGPEFDLEILGFRNFKIDLNIDSELPEPEEKPKQYMIEVKFENDMDKQDLYDDLLSKGYAVKDKSK